MKAEFNDKELKVLFAGLCDKACQLRNNIKEWQSFQDQGFGTRLQIAQFRHKLRHTERALRKFYRVFQ